MHSAIVIAFTHLSKWANRRVSQHAAISRTGHWCVHSSAQQRLRSAAGHQHREVACIVTDLGSKCKDLLSAKHRRLPGFTACGCADRALFINGSSCQMTLAFVSGSFESVTSPLNRTTVWWQWVSCDLEHETGTLAATAKKQAEHDWWYTYLSWLKYSHASFTTQQFLLHAVIRTTLSC